MQFSSGIADLARCEGGIAVPFPCQGPQQLKGGKSASGGEQNRKRCQGKLTESRLCHK